MELIDNWLNHIMYIKLYRMMRHPAVQKEQEKRHFGAIRITFIFN